MRLIKRVHLLVKIILLIHSYNLKERDHFVDLGEEGMKKLKWAFYKYGVRTWSGLSWLRLETN